MYVEREDERWQAYVCADCDPTLFEDEEPNEYDKPYVLAVPQYEKCPEICPRCGSYLPFIESTKGLTVKKERYG